MSESILNTVKLDLGLLPDYDVFDSQIIMHINTVMLSLSQLGVISEAGFRVKDAEDTWDDLLGDDPGLNAVQSYIGLRVKMLFDPPQTSFHISSNERILAELEFRLNVLVDTRPLAIADQIPSREIILTGGDP